MPSAANKFGQAILTSLATLARSAREHPTKMTQMPTSGLSMLCTKISLETFSDSCFKAHRFAIRTQILKHMAGSQALCSEWVSTLLPQAWAVRKPAFFLRTSQAATSQRSRCCLGLPQTQPMAYESPHSACLGAKYASPAHLLMSFIFLISLSSSTISSANLHRSSATSCSS